MGDERPKVCVVQARTMKPTFKKVHIVYYLSRNGHLEHPHYMEVTHLAHHQLRLKDVMDRLTVLRGKGMPSLYSWSCKRSYKNGYVWNDLAENDVIYPSEGAEYVLKGTELLEGCTVASNVQFGNSPPASQDSNFQPKCQKLLASKRRNERPEEMANSRYDHEEDEECSTPLQYSGCSRGISTDDDDQIQEFKQHKNGSFDLSSISLSSPPSTTSSDQKAINNNKDVGINEPQLTRNSVLLSLIVCGGSGSFRKTVPAPQPCTAGRKSGGGGDKAAALEYHEMMIMSDNPRFVKLPTEEKEYFSGSIVEDMNNERIEVESGLKKSSHSEERSNMTGLGEVADEKVEKEKGLKGKCIPRKISSSKLSME